MSKIGNLTGLSVSLGIAAMLLVLTDGVAGWKVAAAWTLWAIGLGLSLYVARPRTTVRSNRNA